MSGRPISPAISVIVSREDTIETFVFAPQRDITTHELARLLPFFLTAGSGDVSEAFALLGPELWRHFEFVPPEASTEVFKMELDGHLQP